MSGCLLGDGQAALATRVADAVAAGTDALVVVGGDGMVHLGVNAAAGTGVPLGIVPAGTGNDIARGARGAGRRPGRGRRGAARRAAAPAAGGRRAVRRRPTASGWFAGVLAAGFDAVVNERANGWGGPAVGWPRGPAPCGTWPRSPASCRSAPP